MGNVYIMSVTRLTNLPAMRRILRFKIETTLQLKMSNLMKNLT